MKQKWINLSYCNRKLTFPTNKISDEKTSFFIFSVLFIFYLSNVDYLLQFLIHHRFFTNVLMRHLKKLRLSASPLFYFIIELYDWFHSLSTFCFLLLHLILYSLQVYLKLQKIFFFI
jgi:hypothetical protein